MGPQVASALLSTHLLLQTWNPALHISPHTPAMQAGEPFGSVGQLMQVDPHPVASLSGAQRVPQRWYPEPQVKSQVVPLQDVASAPVGFGQAVQDVGPQVSTLVLLAQIWLQLCIPAAQTPEQAAPLSMHRPAQGFWPVGQAGMHAVPLQDTVPPVGAVQAVQDVVPQLPRSESLTQRSPQV